VHGTELFYEIDHFAYFQWQHQNQPGAATLTEGMFINR